MARSLLILTQSTLTHAAPKEQGWVSKKMGLVAALVLYFGRKMKMIKKIFFVSSPLINVTNIPVECRKMEYKTRRFHMCPS